jgi:hypothetical protein
MSYKTNIGSDYSASTTQISAATALTGVLPIANGGTNASTASITSFNNITGLSASGTTGTTSTNLVFSTAPTLVTPVLGVATGTSIALNGATLGTNALAIAGTTTQTGASSITADSTTTAGVTIGGGTNVSNYAMSIAAGRAMMGFDSVGGNILMAGGTGKGVALYANATSNTFPSGAAGAALFIQGNSAVSPVGNTGIGLITPTATLHLKAGTAAVSTAPLKLTSGTNLTTPENGAIEFDGTDLTITSGGVRRPISYNNTAQTVSAIKTHTASINADVGVGRKLTSQTGSGAITIDWSVTADQVYTLTGNVTAISFIAPQLTAGYVKRLSLRLNQDATGSRTATGWPGTVKFAGGTAPTLTTGANKADIITFDYDGTDYVAVTTLNF